MKYVFLLLFLSLFSFVFGQTPRSEYVVYNTYCKLDGGKFVRQDTVVLQINERMGDHDATVYIDYTKGDKLSIGDAWIEDMDGNVVRKLKKNEIEDRSYISNSSMYEDDFIKSFELKHSVYPYRIVYSYKKVFSKFLGVIKQDCVRSRIPMRSRKIVVETDVKNPIKYKQQNINEPEIKESSGIKTYTWKFSYDPPKEIELNASLPSIKAPSIRVLPSRFKYGVEGSYDSWQAFGDWIFRLNYKRDELTESEKQKISLLIDNIDDDLEKAKILYKYLQNYTRYINVSIDVGGMQSYPASYVCDYKYGDCKALTNYMQAMLKYANIKSYYTLIDAKETRSRIDKEFPEQAFNHVILTLPLGVDTFYLECTSKNTPFGYISTFIQGREALLIDKDSSRFINIPALNIEDVKTTRKIKVNLETQGVEIVTINRGDDYEYINYIQENENQNSLKKYVRENILNGSYDLLDYEVYKDAVDNISIVLKANCNLHDLYKVYGKNFVVKSLPIHVPAYESPDKRTQEVKIEYPKYCEDIINYVIPDHKITKIPKNIEMESKYGKYSLRFSLEANNLIVNKSIILFAGEYPLSEYKDFFKFISLIRKNENTNYLLETL